MLLIYLVAGVFAVGMSWLATLWVIRFASRLGLLSIPNHRSSHEKVTPHGGGLGIYIAFILLIVVYSCFSDQGRTVPWYVLGLASVIAGIGLWDDIYQVPRKIRLVVQLLSCTALVMLILSPMFLAQSTVYWSVALLLLLILLGVWWINLFNFMDGIDGLAATQAIFMLCGGLTLMAQSTTGGNPGDIAFMMVGLAAASAGFLFHNWSPAKIFMGDVGSTFLAFMILFFALITSTKNGLAYQVWIILGALFVSDASVTLLRRFLSGQRWFDAHNSHAYQRLSRQYTSHAKVSLGFLGVNLLWLFPLAWATLIYQELSWYLVCVAYLPLIVFIWLSGAGMPDNKNDGI